MTKKSKVYTRGGDKGETSLVSGSRCKKSDNRVDLYGDVDELNSYIGLTYAHLETEESCYSIDQELIIKIQSSLFDLGSKLACESEFWDKYKLPDIKENLIESIEKRIDSLDAKLEKLNHFILPGGTLGASHTHIVRTVCRRVERKLIDYREMNNEIPINSVVLLNRLSDYFFVLARSINLSNETVEKKWVPSND